MKIYVGNLSKTTTAAELNALFAKHGVVDDAYLVNDKATGETRCFGFVFMKEDLEAKAAIRHLHGLLVAGSKIKVSESLPKRKKGDAAGPAKRTGPLGPGPQRRFSNRPRGRLLNRRCGPGPNGPVRLAGPAASPFFLFGSDSLTLILLPATSNPWRWRIAALASRSSFMNTKPKQRVSPVALSFTR